MVSAAKSVLKRFISEQKRRSLREILDLPERVRRLENRSRQLVGDSARAHYGGLVCSESDNPRSKLNRYEARYFSQNGEDGILSYVFSQITATDCRFVEIGIGNGEECNAANLFLSFGWDGLMLELVPESASHARRFYRRITKTSRAPDIVDACVLPENVNQLIENNGITGEIDLLSIDIDSNDYWVFAAISVIEPRVIVLEYNAVYGPDRSLTIAYDPQFSPCYEPPLHWYYGASLTALTKLASSKGYRLVGCDFSGTNAFYVRNDVATDTLTEVSPGQAYYHPPGRGRAILEKQFQRIAHMSFVDI